MQPIKTVTLLVLTISLAIACSKDNNKPAGTGYIGKWKLIATKVSPGPLVTEWTEVKDSKEVIEWVDSARFVDREKQVRNYRIYPFPGQDTTAVMMKSWVRGTTDTATSFFDIFNKDTLILDGYCIEGCQWKYKRI